MSKKAARRVLGRGLSALIPLSAQDGTSGENEIVEIDCTIIRPNPFQPRTDIKQEDIKELAESIKSQGLLQPVLVRQKGVSEFEIVSGERRFRALRMLGKNRIPCIVKTKLSDREMMEMALVENIQREDLNDIDKAEAFQRLIAEYSYTHESLAKQIGSSRTAVTNILRLRMLPHEVQQMVRKRLISSGHARALLSVQDNKQRIELAKKIIDENLSVRSIENKVYPAERQTHSKHKKHLPQKNHDPVVSEAISRLQYKLGTPVSINMKTADHRGRVIIEFFSEKDLTRIFDVLLSGTSSQVAGNE
jgi:ParB family chromosome partitioning protein